MVRVGVLASRMVDCCSPELSFSIESRMLQEHLPAYIGYFRTRTSFISPVLLF